MIELGTILFTLVEPWKGHEAAYNRWYERDHFYAGCMVGPGILAGRRFVATRRHKDLRHGDMGGSYLALYWISREQQDEWGAWAGKEVHRLHAAGRMFRERDHVHTSLYRYRGGVFRDPDGVPAELALDHPFPGLVACLADEARSDLLPSAAMCLSFTPVPIPSDAPSDVPRERAGSTLLLYFLDRDPAEVWGAEFEGRQGEWRWAAPFIPTIPGTDTYTDEP